MKIKKILWILFLIFLLLLGILCEKSLFLTVALVLIILEAFSLLYGRFALKRLSVDLKFPGIAGKEKETKGKLIIKLKYLLPLSEIKANCKIKNKFTGEEKAVTISTFMGMKKTEKIPLGLSREYCGCINIAVENIEIVDLWGIFSNRKILGNICKIFILPETTNIKIEESSGTTAIDSWKFVESNSASSGEMYDIREYVKGDNIKNIHWKLTGKYETPMVKKMSKETEDLVMILFNNVDEQESYEAWDKLGQRLFSLSKSLIEKNISHSVSWCSKGKWITYKITDQKDLTGNLLKVLDVDSNKDYFVHFEKKLQEQKLYYENVIVVSN